MTESCVPLDQYKNCATLRSTVDDKPTNYETTRPNVDENMEDKKLCIAMFVGTFPIYSETFISRKIDYLVQQGHDVHVFCHHFDRSMPNADAYKKIVHQLKSVSGDKFKHFCPSENLARIAVRSEQCFHLCGNLLKTALYDARSLRKIFRTGSNVRRFWQLLNLSASSFFARNWDIVHCHYLINVGMIQEIRSEIACPIIASVYGHDATVFPYTSSQNFADVQAWIKQVDGLIYSSEFLRQETQKIASTKGLSEGIIHPETPTDLFLPCTRESLHTPLRILSVGRLHWTKGYSVALKAMEILRERNVDFQYRVIGEGEVEARSELEYLIRNRGLHDNVSLDGRKKPEEVSEAMQWADVFLLPSVREDFGVVLTEAQASGLPIVASRVGGVPEATNEGQTSLLVEPGNPVAFADALQKICHDTALFCRMSTQGPIFAQKFDTNVSGKQLEQFYNECIAHQKNG